MRFTTRHRIEGAYSGRHSSRQQGGAGEFVDYREYVEGEDLRLIPYAIAYRFFFITMIDVAKLFATAEEVARVRMTWGKLERVGRL